MCFVRKVEIAGCALALALSACDNTNYNSANNNGANNAAAQANAAAEPASQTLAARPAGSAIVAPDPVKSRLEIIDAAFVSYALKTE